MTELVLGVASADRGTPIKPGIVAAWLGMTTHADTDQTAVAEWGWADGAPGPSPDLRQISRAIDRLTAQLRRVYLLMLIVWVIVPVIAAGVVAILIAVGLAQFGGSTPEVPSGGAP